jgi:hypothetical protein
MVKTTEGNDGGIRLYRNTIDRRRAMALLKKEGYNYFVGFTDANSIHVGLSYGRMNWVGLFPYEQDL